MHLLLRLSVHTEPLERLLILITKLGISFDLRNYEDEEKADQPEFVTINQYQFSERRAEVTQALAREKIHYLTSRETQLAVHMCSQNAHTRIYALSANSRDAVKRIRNFKSKQMTDGELTEEAIEAWDSLNLLMLNQLNTLQWAERMLGLDQNALRALTAFFQKRDGAWTMKDVGIAMMMEGKPAFVKKTVINLMNQNLITSDAGIGPKLTYKKGKTVSKVHYYMITDKGIGKVMEYRNYVHSITFKTN